MKFLIYLISLFGFNLGESLVRGKFKDEKRKLKKFMAHLKIMYCLVFLNFLFTICILALLIPEKKIKLQSIAGFLIVISVIFATSIIRPVIAFLDHRTEKSMLRSKREIRKDKVNSFLEKILLHDLADYDAADNNRSD